MLSLDQVRRKNVLNRVLKGEHAAFVRVQARARVEKAYTKREMGEDFPPAAFAYVPDAKKPSTWKLRLWDSLEQKATPSQVGAAVAALGKGFRGKKVQIPAADLGKVKDKVRAAYRRVNPGKELPAVLS